MHKGMPADGSKPGSGRAVAGRRAGEGDADSLRDDINVDRFVPLRTSPLSKLRTWPQFSRNYNNIQAM